MPPERVIDAIDVWSSVFASTFRLRYVPTIFVSDQDCSLHIGGLGQRLGHV